MHFTCLPHDCFVKSITLETVLPRGSSDAALMPYHVDRSKLYVTHRIGGSKHLDASRICRAIEFTRFPVQATYDKGDDECTLVRAASIIGQLADPRYLQKAHAPCIKKLRKSVSIKNTDTLPRRTSSICTREFTSTVSHRISTLQSAT
jgi:hypothetical protein